MIRDIIWLDRRCINLQLLRQNLTFDTVSAADAVKRLLNSSVVSGFWHLLHVHPPPKKRGKETHDGSLLFDMVDTELTCLFPPISRS